MHPTLAMTEPRPTPLQHSVFRAIWLATVVSNLGTWIQNVGAAWLMTSLSPSALMVALIQTATSLPMFLLSLPAGALADMINRRKLLLLSHFLFRDRPETQSIAPSKPV